MQEASETEVAWIEEGITRAYDQVWNSAQQRGPAADRAKLYDELAELAEQHGRALGSWLEGEEREEHLNLQRVTAWGYRVLAAAERGDTAQVHELAARENAEAAAPALEALASGLTAERLESACEALVKVPNIQEFDGAEAMAQLARAYP